jgi:hypothetical protein
MGGRGSKAENSLGVEPESGTFNLRKRDVPRFTLLPRPSSETPQKEWMIPTSAFNGFKVYAKPIDVSSIDAPCQEDQKRTQVLKKSSGGQNSNKDAENQISISTRRNDLSVIRRDPAGCLNEAGMMVTTG